MKKYVYPAIFTAENKGYSITFPDIESCYTQGDDLIDGIEMAKDILALTLYQYEIENKEIPAPSAPNTLKPNKNSFVTLIDTDTIEYRKMHNNTIVKKTLTMPSWLNEMALQENINFSNVLQEALMKKLDIIK